LEGNPGLESEYNSVQPGKLDSLIDAPDNIHIISEEEANEIYMQVATQSADKKGYVKKNWTDKETRLLKWAVVTYARNR